MPPLVWLLLAVYVGVRLFPSGSRCGVAAACCDGTARPAPATTVRIAHGEGGAFNRVPKLCFPPSTQALLGDGRFAEAPLRRSAKRSFTEVRGQAGVGN